MPTTTERSVKASLSGLELATVELLYQLSQSTGRRVKSGARYCFPSQAWIAGRLGVSRRSINHVVARLRRLGILDVLHRRKKEGRWQSNLYKVINCVSWWRYRLAEVFRPTPHREKQSSLIENPKKETVIVSEGPPVAGSVSGVLADLILALDAKPSPFSFKS